MNIGLGIRKNANETWLQAALRNAAPYGLEIEVKEEYDYCIAQGFTEARAALNACYEWDVALLMDENEVE
jgi:hypothetical protein